ncbi:jerky protein homolog-like [Anthonomus grandis grandis]|uniref:jerky protein homolog-like n=1 Tax=Anthonomus grandis grandis TaxID=2921223 RepID=UPI0021660879|nr:jerky protein homolog-like [Anthonomus grandis grandis]
MTQEMFKNCFFKHFVPEVKSFLQSKNLPLKAVLLLDNAPSHPPAEELKTSDGHIFVVYMPPNVTPLIQPLDQNILRITKLFYRKGLLSSIVSKGQGVAEALKVITLRDAIMQLHMDWQKIEPSVISKCWNNIFGKNLEEDDLSLARLKEIWENDVRAATVNETITLLRTIEQIDYNHKHIEEWNTDAVEENLDSNDSEDSVCEVLTFEEKKVTHLEALAALKIATQWANQNYVDIKDIITIKGLEEKAVALNLSQKKVQTKITSFFK